MTTTARTTAPSAASSGNPPAWTCAARRPAAGVAAAATPAAGLRAAHVQAGGLPELAADGAVVRAVVVIAGDPRTVQTPFGEQVYVKASARLVIGRGRTLDVRAPVLLMAEPGVG